MGIFDRFANQFSSQFRQGTLGQGGLGQGAPGKSTSATGFGTRKRPQTMAEWQTYIDGLSRPERDQLYPSMHKDLIPAYEMITGGNPTWGTENSANENIGSELHNAMSDREIAEPHAQQYSVPSTECFQATEDVARIRTMISDRRAAIENANRFVTLHTQQLHRADTKQTQERAGLELAQRRGNQSEIDKAEAAVRKAEQELASAQARLEDSQASVKFHEAELATLQQSLSVAQNRKQEACS